MRKHKLMYGSKESAYLHSPQAAVLNNNIIYCSSSWLIETGMQGSRDIYYASAMHTNEASSRRVILNFVTFSLGSYAGSPMTTK